MLRRLNPKIPRDLETITLKCLEKNPCGATRLPGAGEDLSGMLDNRPIQGCCVSLFQRGWRSARRRPAVASLIATVAVTVLASCVALYELYRHAKEVRVQAVAARDVSQRNAEVASILLDRLERLVQNSITCQTRSQATN